MADKQFPNSLEAKPKPTERQASRGRRLAVALRRNLKKRKSQHREREGAQQPVRDVEPEKL
ncbi:MAG: hypothetical protein EXQ90_05775 [Rhodospirillales bacterium]|nr:hypothetical protein [Rhodospirillales bacterium]